VLIHDRFVFIHMPKTAGSFIADALRRELPAGSLVRGKEGTLHPGWSEIPVGARGLPVLVFVRNPWDWYVSWYHFLMSQKPGSIAYRVLLGNGKNDFATSIRNACGGLVEPGRPMRVRFVSTGDDFYAASLRRFCDAGWNSALLTVGRYEFLIDDLAEFLSKAGVPLSGESIERIRMSRPLKVTAHRPYREYYDDALRDLVGRSCRSLIERFDYHF
jgi:hypothetical protein